MSSTSGSNHAPDRHRARLLGAQMVRLPIGVRVEIRNRFDGAWASGFEVVRPRSNGYVVRRLSDGAVLPVTFAATAVRMAPTHPGGPAALGVMTWD
jgi:hypothetical protein